MTKKKSELAESVEFSKSEEVGVNEQEQVTQAEETAAVDVTPAQETAAVAEDEPLKRFVVSFNPPSPIGERARRMEVDARNASEAETIWRRETGFLGQLGAPLRIDEIATQAVEESPAE